MPSTGKVSACAAPAQSAAAVPILHLSRIALPPLVEHRFELVREPEFRSLCRHKQAASAPLASPAATMREPEPSC
jgi:hypothetical protein